MKRDEGQDRTEVLDPLTVVRSDHGCFGCGDANPIGLHLHFTRTTAGVVAQFTPEIVHQGFDGIVHGGIISTVLDEAMAWATAAAGLWTVTGEIQIRFRQPLRVGAETRVEAQVTDTRRRLVKTAAELLLLADNSVVASATATFVRVAAETETAWRARYLTQSSQTGDLGTPTDVN
ncbi:MAG: PaaI family thioesterase [Thermomicrobiales bacterium]